MVKQTDSQKSTATDRKTPPSKSSTTPGRSKDFLDLDAIEGEIMLKGLTEAIKAGRLKPADEITGED